MNTISPFDNVSKYTQPSYKRVLDGIYKTGDHFVTSLSFEQEPELGEGKDAASISQFPLEDILDQFSVYVSDFYPEKNTPKSKTCYLEFSGYELEDIIRLRGLIGKHVYNREIRDNSIDYIELVVE